jgi:PAS domain S-box-containing protein
MNERVLLVDDKPEIIEFCTRLLKDHGYDLVSADSGQKAIAQLQEQTFDLLVADIMMPVVDGLEVLRVAKEIDPEIAVVVITGYGTLENAVEALRAGAQGFVIKPFTSEELISSVQEVLSKRQLARENARLRALIPLLEMAQISVSTANMDELTNLAAQITVRETAAEWACLVLPRAGQQNLTPTVTIYTAAHREQMSLDEKWLHTVTTFIMERDKPLISMGDANLPEEIRSGFPGSGSGWAAAFPLSFKEEPIGALILGSAADASGLKPDDYELALILSSQVAGVMSNAELFNQLETTVAELSALKQYNESVLRNMSNGLITVDALGKVISYNQASEKLLSCPLRLGDGLTPESAPPTLRDLAAILKETWETQTPISHRELSFPLQDGRSMPLKVSTSLLRDEAGRPSGVISILEDLSELRALEEKRHRQDRLAMLGQMAAQVAHEIRNPLVTIGLGVQYLEKGLEPDSTRRKAVQRITRQLERLEQTVNEFLSFSKPSSLRFERRALGEVVDDTMEIFSAHLQEHHITLGKEYDPDLPPVLLDAEQIERAVADLVMNAVEAMPQGGKITIRTGLVEKPGGPMAELSIADTGVGILPENMDKIFEPFFSTHAKGTGLGLPIARRIIEEHGGTITAASDPGQGATFTILLPLEKKSDGRGDFDSR